MSRSARSAWNFLTVVAFSVISMVVALVVTPTLLRELGPARLGATRALMDWAGYLTLLELGLSGALMPLLVRALAQGDRARVRATLSAGFRAYSMVTIAMAAGGGLLIMLIVRLVKVDATLHHDLRFAAIFAVAPVLLMPLSPMRALIEADQRGYMLSGFLIVQSLVIALSGVAFAKLRWGITGQTLAITLGAVVYYTLIVVDVCRNASGFLPSKPLQGDAQSSREIRNLNTPALIISVCGRVGLLTDNIVIGAILTAPMIVPFVMTQRLGQIAQSQLQAVGSASWASLAQLHANGDEELFRTRFLELNRLVMMLGLAALIPIVAYNGAFVRLWVGSASYGGIVLTAVAACNALALSVSSLWGWLFGGTGQMSRLVPTSLVSMVVNLVVSVGFTWFMSKHDPSKAIWGPVLGTSAALFLVNLPLMPGLMRTHFRVPVGALMKSVMVPLFLGAPFSVVLLWVAKRRPPEGWLMLGVDMAIAGLCFALLCWQLLLGAQDRRRWLHRARLVIRR
jgi:O-antigen/teichoic acid export membrane protein